MRILLNPEEYAMVCKCSLELAAKRCSYFENLYKKNLEPFALPAMLQAIIYTMTMMIKKMK